MKLCACNNCCNLYEDLNPKSNAPEYPDEISVFKLKWMTDMDNISMDGESTDILSWFYGCPMCCTDSYLTDDIQNHADSKNNRNLILETIENCSKLEEYQEENSTAWSRLQNLKKLMNWT